MGSRKGGDPGRDCVTRGYRFFDEGERIEAERWLLEHEASLPPRSLTDQGMIHGISEGGDGRLLIPCNGNVDAVPGYHRSRAFAARVRRLYQRVQFEPRAAVKSIAAIVDAPEECVARVLVRYLRHHGFSVRAIESALSINRGTVSRYLRRRSKH